MFESYKCPRCGRQFYSKDGSGGYIEHENWTSDWNLNVYLHRGIDKMICNFDMRDDKGNRRQLTDEEQKSLTKAVLYADLSSLAIIQDGKVTNMEDIMDLLKDTTLLNKSIDDSIKSLQKTVKDRKQLNWYLNSAKFSGENGVASCPDKTSNLQP